MSDMMIDAARRYAAADRTDPFAFGRAVAHIQNGLARHTRGSHNQEFGLGAGDAAYYSADRYVEERKIQAGDRTLLAVVPSYRNVVRP